MSLIGKHALVTGGGTGIGLAIAQVLADAGAHVTITGRRLDVLNAQSGGNIFGQQMDVTDEENVRLVCADIVQSRGPIQICVLNAGIAEGRGLAHTDLAFWRRMMATNLDGAFLCVREAMHSMLKTDWGRVIAISSIAGVRGLRGAPAYSASKHGIATVLCFDYRNL